MIRNALISIPKILRTSFTCLKKDQLFHTSSYFKASASSCEILSLNFNELPENSTVPALPLETLSSNLKKSLLEQVRYNMNTYENHVVLTRVGSFYELYYEHAEVYAPLLNIKLASKYLTKGRVAMAGFPSTQLERYLKVLVQDLQKSVAIIEQYEFEAKSGLLERKAARVITPGTLIDEGFMNFQDNNYLLVINFGSGNTNKPEQPVGLTWVDLSLGSIYVQESSLKNLASDIYRIQPREIVLDKKLLNTWDSGTRYKEYLSELKKYLISYSIFPPRSTLSSYSRLFESTVSELHEYLSKLSTLEVKALSALMVYLERQLPEIDLTFQLPVKRYSESVMRIDSQSAGALEIFKTIRHDSMRGSLLSTIKRTVTQSGARELVEWVSNPLLDIASIERRQNAVQQFLERPSLKASVISALSSSNDLARIVQRISLNRADATDLVSLARAILCAETIKERILLEIDNGYDVNSSILDIFNNILMPVKLARKILLFVDEDCLMEKMRQDEIQSPESLESISVNDIRGKKQIKERRKDGLDIFVLKPGASRILESLHKKEILFNERKDQLVTDLISSLDSPRRLRLELKWSPDNGHFALFRGSNISQLSNDSIPGEIIKRSGTTMMIKYSPWTVLGSERDSIRENIRKEENRILKLLQIAVLKEKDNIRRLGKALNFLDITSSFAELAKEHNLVKPNLNSGTETKIVEGRHIVVEQGLIEKSANFVSNDCILNDSESLWIITGPNMGGKSTFLRQTALINLLAQIGCYVPAKSAELGIVDQIFCRVGSADDLYRDQSTFMVEMLETSYILKNATKRSLAIMDEIGRGTSHKDGLAIAYATVIYLILYNNCRSLFATHFGPELHNLINENTECSRKIGYYCTDVKDTPGKRKKKTISDSMYFTHKIRPGVATNSHGLFVASMAGFPLEALDMAAKVVSKLNT
ncbi:hypothetical protein NADFUDRAFT_20105 [Nadsonia fulvescens var. elongata DSM 6958]|uniref:DNA mismatch repair proteins mutS family domain-containing protein n=1 Tax=Nadsonia fulvescens var. elongata DSM 6958 TaxID=857566 RepID=A0A1E3PTH7_9ASCO|nr:hypothetical protein NADFUDRAFT_20105 [Nadsonia fulvescens var. elongata DSM 6958]